MDGRARARSGAWLAAILAASLAVGACGGGDGGGNTGTVHLKTAPGAAAGDSASATIGAAGGTIASADGGLSVTIPAGAVTSDTVFTVTPVTKPAGNAVAAYRLEPEGTAFAAPVTLAFRAADAGVAYPGLAFLAVALHEADGTWRLLESAAKDKAAKTVSAQVSHFSEYSMISGFQFQPPSVAVEVEGAAELTIHACADPWMLAKINGEVPDDLPADLPDPLIFECKPVYFEGARADQWAVDGVPGGDDTHGTIEATGDCAGLFNAPKKKPDPSTVAVSTWFHYSNYTSLQDILVAYVAITDDDKYFGSFLVKAFGPAIWTEWTATGSAKWKVSDNPYEYLVTGTVKADQTIFPMGDDTCTLIGAERPFSYDYGAVKETPAPATIFWVIGPLNWSANCCDAQGNCQVVDPFLTLTWSSGCGAHWAELDAAELKDNGALKGTYTWPSAPCAPTVTGMPYATVEWLFLRYGGAP